MPLEDKIKIEFCLLEERFAVVYDEYDEYDFLNENIQKLLQIITNDILENDEERRKIIYNLTFLDDHPVNDHFIKYIVRQIEIDQVVVDEENIKYRQGFHNPP